MRTLLSLLTSLSVTACGAAPASVEPPRTAPPTAAAVSSTPSPVALPKSAPVATNDVGHVDVGHVAGVTFRVPSGWTLVSDGNLAVAKNPSGNIGFVFWGGEASDAPTALHRAEQEFKTTFPIAVGSLTQQIAIGKLPYGFILSQAMEEKAGRIKRSSVLSSRGVNTAALALLAYVELSKGNEAAESKRASELLDTILQSFEPER